MSSYVANYPLVDDNDRYKLAFADQVEQKILSKLRGLEMHEESTTQTLSKIGDVISKLGDNQLAKAFKRSKDTSTRHGIFQWHGVTRDLDEDN